MALAPLGQGGYFMLMNIFTQTAASSSAPHVGGVVIHSIYILHILERELVISCFFVRCAPQFGLHQCIAVPHGVFVMLSP